MAISNYERVTKALELLRAGLGPYVERELSSRTKIPVTELGYRFFPGDGINSTKAPRDWDVSALLKVMWDTWNDVFKATLGYSDRNLVSELRNMRNSWAHQQPFNFDDTYRALDSTERLLNAISAAGEAQEVARSKAELLRLRHEEQSRAERKKVALATVEAQGNVSLSAWREVVSPHEDVAVGNYQNAEFAADLWQVFLGQAAPEYQDPVEYFRRTYLTQSLRGLLKGAMARVSRTGGDPVIQLQTNFGGGKTHSMLALYHLLSGGSPSSLLGIDELMSEAGIESIPAVKRVVLVGTKISPSTPSIKSDGTVVNTLWGELAYQLGGAEAYAVVASDDANATSPGDALRQLMNTYGPCLILVDEWVAYARQLHDDFDLAGGSFDTQFTFAQALTESASGAEACLLVVSLPASDTASSLSSSADDIEVGGERGRAALERLRNAVGRVEATWRPANAEESFEIVRRRLFNPLTSREQFVVRDAVAKGFSQLYQAHGEDFPPESRTPDYEKSIRDAYPIHPEVFERLYTDWSTLAKFQRTRGVLRLMAAVIHSLWMSGNSSPLILPAHIPMDDAQVRSELTRYLPDNWTPVIDKDIDGPNSLPVSLDTQIPELGRYLACRRVTRTIYLGSAPTARAANRGLDARRVKLGCVMPGEPPAKFNDALRRLAQSATYLYSDDARYWFDTQPTVTKLVEDRAERLRSSPDKVIAELKRRLNLAVGTTEFPGVHQMPASGADVPDELVTRLVILGPEDAYLRDPNQKSPAEKRAAEILESRGNAPRRYRNTLVFLAPDQGRLAELDGTIRQYLAWTEVLGDSEELGLTPFQVRQAEAQRDAADQRVGAQLPETYQSLLVPVQASPTDQVTINVIRLSGQGALDARAKRRLQHDELLLTSMGGTVLRHHLDRIPLWTGDNNSVSVSKLVEYFASYVYLPRLMSPSVLYGAIEAGTSQLMWKADTFAYAERYDATQQRFLGLVGGQGIRVREGDQGLIVHPEVASRQLDHEVVVEPQSPTPPRPGPGPGQGGAGGPAAESPKPRRYHATVELDPERSSEVSRIYAEVVSYLAAASPGETRLRITLEIEAMNPEGFSEQVIRTVRENGTTLRFGDQGFEES